MREYHCRKCGRFLFESDATSGRLRLSCKYRDCKVGQMVFLGGHFKDRRLPFPDQISPVEKPRETRTG